MRAIPEPDGPNRTLPVDLWDVMVGDVIHSSALPFEAAEDLVLSIRAGSPQVLDKGLIYAQEHKEG